MQSMSQSSRPVKQSYPALGDRNSEKQWYAAQTRSRHEKAVAEQLQQRNIEGFLPLYERVSRWKDRRVRLQLPLFDGYIFVRIAIEERLRALEIPGIARLIGFGGVPTALPDDEIESLRNQLMGGIRAVPHPYLTIGRRVAIRSGPLAGLSGILLRKKSQYRLVVSIDLIQRSMAVDVDVADIVPMVEQRIPVSVTTLYHSNTNSFRQEAR